MSDSENQRLLLETILDNLGSFNKIAHDLSTTIADLRVELATLEAKVESLQKTVSEIKAQEKSTLMERTKGQWAFLTAVITGLIGLLGYALKDLFTK